MSAARAVPRLVVGAAASGSGKTTIVCGLARAFRRRGLRVALFKCGPDYLDPTYHTRAAGTVSHTLDGWMMGRDAVRRTFARATAGADLAIVEGVMGLFDGAGPDTEAGSTAEIAKWIEAPVLVTLDASGMARTVAALAGGLADFDPALRVAGLIANRVGSPGHLDLLRRASRTVPVLGGLVREADGAFPARHLGLRTASRDGVDETLFDLWADRVEQGLDLDRILALAREAPAGSIETAPGRGGRERRCRIGIASDEAFHFYYPENLARLEEAGAELVPFSPIRDAVLPEVDGLYLGGGYPEVYAGALSANEGMRRAVRDFAAADGPVYAECGGLMYLARVIRTLDGTAHPMVGLVDGECRMHERWVALGYVEVETRLPTPLGPAGLRFRGHQFRYSDLEGDAGGEAAYRIRRRRGREAAEAGFASGNVLASYIHAHWASNPNAAAGLVDACAAFAGGRG